MRPVTLTHRSRALWAVAFESHLPFRADELDQVDAAEALRLMEVGLAPKAAAEQVLAARIKRIKDTL